MRAPNLRRSYRKQHLGWPYPWIPFARSGDSSLLKTAEAATRQLVDAAWCDYVSDELKGKEEGMLGYWG